MRAGVNLERFASAASVPRVVAVAVPELEGWGLFADGEPLVWKVRSLTALEFFQCAEAQNEAVRKLHTALAKALSADSEDGAAALREVAEATPGEFSKKLDMVARASVYPALGAAQRDVVVRLSEVLPVVFFRLCTAVENAFLQGAELGKPRPSGAATE